MSPFSFLLRGSSHLYWVSGVNLCLRVSSPSPVQSLVMTMTSPCLLGLYCGSVQLLSLDSRTQLEHKMLCWGCSFWLGSTLSAEIRFNGGWNPGCQIIRSFPFMAIVYNSNMFIPSESTHWAPVICQSLYHCWEYNSEQKCIFILVTV